MILKILVFSLLSFLCVAAKGWHKGCCHIFTDPHFITFDGKYIGYQNVRDCKYKVSEGPDFKVEAQNEYRFGLGGVSVLRFLQITYAGVVVTLEGFSMGAAVRVNGIVVTLPYSGPAGNIFILNGAFGPIVVLSNGVTVEYDDTGARRIVGWVCVPECYMKTLKGVCGNYDNNAPNDLVDSTGVYQPNNQGGWDALGDSWLSAPCAPRRGKRAVKGENGCSTGEGAEHCEQFVDTSGPYGDCISQLQDVYPDFLEGLVAGCRTDMCAANRDPDTQKQLLNEILKVLKRMCSRMP